MQVGGGVIEVLSTGGDAHLGGDDWDAAIMQWLIEEHLKPARIDCRVGGLPGRSAGWQSQRGGSGGAPRKRSFWQSSSLFACCVCVQPLPTGAPQYGPW